MKQITEDFVSYETAKLLKEKGFVGNGDIGCKCGFYSQNINYPNQIDLVYDDLDNSELEHNECLRPTHQMAHKWLREVHKIFICIVFLEDIDMYGFTIEDTSSKKYLATSKNDGYAIYEKACEAAIKYCLKNLI